MKRAARVALPVAWMLVLWMLSSIPAKPDQTMAGWYIPTVVQKAMHVAAYGVLGAAWAWVFGLDRLTLTAGGCVLGLAIAYAAVDEIHQTFVPGRYGSARDVALDAAAALLAVVAVRAVLRRRSTPVGS